MKEVKIFLAAAVVVAVCSAFAFTSVKYTIYYRLDANGDCREPFVGTPNPLAPFVEYNIVPSNNACPLLGRIKTPE